MERVTRSPGRDCYNSNKFLPESVIGTVGVRDLKNRLTHYLRRVKQGEEVVVTEHGRPIALIRPIRTGNPGEDREARLAMLAAQGFLTLPTRKLLKRVQRVRVKGAPVSRTILADRR